VDTRVVPKEEALQGCFGGEREREFLVFSSERARGREGGREGGVGGSVRKNIFGGSTEI